MHQRTMEVTVTRQVPEDVHDLGVEDGRRFKVFTGSGGSGEDKNTRANDGTDSKSGQRPGAKRLLETVAGFGGIGN